MPEAASLSMASEARMTTSNALTCLHAPGGIHPAHGLDATGRLIAAHGRSPALPAPGGWNGRNASGGVAMRLLPDAVVPVEALLARWPVKRL